MRKLTGNETHSVTFPEDAVNTMESHEHVDAVELDKPVHTQ